MRTASRRGIAIPATMITLTIIALFIAGTAYFALQEVRAGRNTMDEVPAMEAAEYAAAAVSRDWDRTSNLALSVGSTLGAFPYLLSGGASATARVTRATVTTFWVTADGGFGRASLGSGARRSLAVLYRLLVPQPDVRAALTARDSVAVRNGGVISGTDSVLGRPRVIPSCADAAPPVAGTATPDTGRVCDGSCGSAAGNVRGAPARLADPATGDSGRYVLFGDQTWQSLSSMADIVLPPNAIVTPGPISSGGTCQRGPASNWGDPSGTTACASYVPIILAQGDVTVAGGGGQGILLAAGDIRLNAGATFVGFVVARDDIVTSTGGASIIGAALAGDARAGPGDHTVVEAGGVIRYSACGLWRALLGSAPLARVRQRAWMELF